MRAFQKTPAEYGRLAVELAGDLPRRSHTRGTLRERMEATALMDAPDFARDLTASYRERWRKWCGQIASLPCPK
jgi:predicted O-linked N-acetylglucosamine transferase (SPINDLY family)